jgi:glycosyltransferase involved in cell wall biosynthesis
MSKRVLFCYPWALHEAIGSRVVLLSYARALGRMGLTVDCFAPAPAPVPRAANGLYLGVFDRLFAPPATSPLMRTLLDAAGAGCIDPALPSPHGCDAPAMMAAATVAASGGYALVGIHYARWHSIQPLLPPGVPAVLFTHELDAVVAEQESAVFGTPRHGYTLAMEASRLSAFDAVTTVGPHDREALLEVDATLPVYEAPITIDRARPAPVTANSPGVLLLMSSSAIFHELSLAWFLSHAWPAIKTSHPTVRLLLAGHICKTARRFGADRDPQIELLGVVDDPEPVYARADVFIAPYYFGGGIKLKVLEALARGLPVVTTGPGISNTNLAADRDLLVADDGAAFAGGVIDLLRRPERRLVLQDAALRFIERHHSHAVADSALQTVVESLLTAANADRAITVQSTRQTPHQFVSHLQRAVLRALEGSLGSDDAESSPTLAYLGNQLRALLPWAIFRAREHGVRSVAVYGAGSHTRLMLPIWRALGGPPATMVIVSGAPESLECCGLPVVSIDAFDPQSVDGVLLSSQGFERAMADICSQRFPDLPVFPVWSPPSSPSGDAVPPTHTAIPVSDDYAPALHR